MIARLCLMAGALCILAALTFTAQAVWTAMTAVRVEGRLDRIVGDNRYSTFVVRYQLDGQIKELESRQYEGSDTHWRVGMPVTVVYPADHPEQAEIFNFAEQWSLPILFSMAGAGFLLYGRKGFASEADPRRRPRRRS